MRSKAAQVWSTKRGTGRERLYPRAASPVRTSLRSVARSPSGKAKVCKTFIGGSIPPRDSKIFSQDRGIAQSQRGKHHEQDSFGSARSQPKVQRQLR